MSASGESSTTMHRLLHASGSHPIPTPYDSNMEYASLEPVFESLIITGLKEFLGCPAIFYEAALTEFFANGSVRDGVVIYHVSISCLKKELKIEYRLLHDILAKTIYVKAGSFDAVTRDRFMLMTAITQAKGFAIQIGVVLSNIPGLELGEPRAFPPPRVLNEKTVHRFVHINEQVGVEKTTGSPPMKKTPKKRAVSKKRPVDSDAEVAPIVKKKRTTKSKPAAAIRLPVEEPVSTTSEQPVVEVATGEREPVAEVTTGDADAAIEQVLAQMDLVFKDSDVERGDRNETWFDRALDEELENANQEIQDSEDETDFDVDIQELPVLDETRTILEAGEKAICSKQSDEEHMSIDDILIKGDFDVGMGGNSLERAVRRRVYILAKYKEMLLRKFLESHRKYHVPGQPWTATAIDLLSVAHSKSLEDLIAQQKAKGIPIEQPCTSTYLDSSIGSGAVLAQFYSMAKSKCWFLFTERYFSDLPSISAVVWSKVGGAELVSLSPFDCYQLGDLSRRVGGALRNFSVREFLRQLTREFFSSFELLGATGNLAGQSGASASRSPFG
ncbi:hypothetical protein F511_24957 [Dorcoceras hygrometricum]|uniref:Uncharacterized protein n=1 Tax=Dorcoceras hygrometricum TaxID=472368 RepID=A0A2Z7DDD7_9LAMI|nr:hypothetical protein F511_24957 [Dorcoceras hygrometricum]